MQLLTIENNELRLSTNLDEYTFGKTSHDAILSNEGILFDGKNFRQWTFDEVKSYDAEKDGSLQHIVFYCVENPLSENAKTLAEYYAEGGKKSLNAVKAVCTALTAAATNGNQIPLVGAGGIMVDGGTFFVFCKYPFGRRKTEPARRLFKRNYKRPCCTLFYTCRNCIQTSFGKSALLKTQYNRKKCRYFRQKLFAS